MKKGGKRHSVRRLFTKTKSILRHSLTKFSLSEMINAILLRILPLPTMYRLFLTVLAYFLKFLRQTKGKKSYLVPYFFLLCEAGARRYEPTVADGSLVQIVAAHSLYDQFWVLHNILQKQGKEQKISSNIKGWKSVTCCLLCSTQTTFLQMEPPLI